MMASCVICAVRFLRGDEGVMAKKLMSDLDVKMFEKGYASARLVSRKLGRDIATVHRLAREGRLRQVQVGEQRFVEIASVLEYAGADGVVLLDLQNWRDEP